MRRVCFLLFNISMVLGVSCSVFLYSVNESSRARQLRTDAFVDATGIMSEMANNYLDSDMIVCRNWINYINQSSFTMEEAVEFIRKSKTDDQISGHIIWADTLAGLSTNAKITDASAYSVNYATSLSGLFSQEESSGALGVTRSYTNPMNGESVVALYGRVQLLDDATGLSREAYLLHILPKDYMADTWNFQFADTQDYSVSIINSHGDYVIRDNSVKNSNFYQFIFSYNPDIQTQVLQEEMQAGIGSFQAADAGGEKTLYAFAHLPEYTDWILVRSENSASAVSANKHWGIVLLVVVALGLLLIVDVCYFYILYRRERQAQLQLKEQEIALKDALDAAQHANRAKTMFLNNMSHDIRTPMNAIIGFTALAASHVEHPEQVKDYLSKIAISSEHLLSLINDVLDMSRIESGKVKVEEREMHLPDLFHDLRSILQASISAKSLELFVDTLDVHHEDIIADKLRLNQILLNITGNAIKFTKPGGTITIRVIEKPGAPAGYADYEFCVKDTGIGISKEFAEHIFEAFSREETSTVSGIQGTGLGMAITKNIVNMMGGTITVNSEQGVGTEFIVALRFRISESHAVTEVIPDLQGLRALVADDDLNTCASVTKMLNDIGMRSEWTTSGKEAVFRTQLAVENADEFSAFIIDWMMPDMNGIETVRRIRKIIGESKPIIILTAYDWTDVEEEAREAGVTAFCHKPIFKSELLEILTTPYQIRKESDAKESVDFTGKHILLAEDNELNQEIAAEILGEAGFQVEVAGDGTEAVDKMSKAKPGEYDLILMDIQMPRMDGYDATLAIRQIPDQAIANIPIIAMTANAFEEDKKHCLEVGMNGFVAKPIEIAKLMDVLADIFR